MRKKFILLFSVGIFVLIFLTTSFSFIQPDRGFVGEPDTDEYYWTIEDTIRFSILLGRPSRDGGAGPYSGHVLGERYPEIERQFNRHANPEAVRKVLQSLRGKNADLKYKIISVMKIKDMAFLIDFKDVQDFVTSGIFSPDPKTVDFAKS